MLTLQGEDWLGEVLCYPNLEGMSLLDLGFVRPRLDYDFVWEPIQGSR